MNRSPLSAFLLIALLLACFALSPTARAVLPAPDGGYANQNTAEGTDSLFSLDTSQGTDNTAVGFEALFSTTTGLGNTAAGSQALANNIRGNGNTAVGVDALFSNTAGKDNTAVGFNALGKSDATENTAIGFQALQNNISGAANAALGAHALENNTVGSSNTASGVRALASNTIGGANTATGTDSLGANTTGISNTAAGVSSLKSNTTGNNNTATGINALVLNTTGNDNTATGQNALLNNTTGNHNIALGINAGMHLTTGSNNIEIGSSGVRAEANTIRLGTVGTQQSTFIAGISGQTVAGGVSVLIDTSGHLGTVTSSARYKEAIKPMDKASEAILALQPVTFHYRPELDPEGIPQFGLVAEQVEKVNPDLVARDAQGKAYTVRYEAVNAMLLNEFLKEHHQVQELKATAAQQQKEIKALTASLKEQASQIQRVNEQLGASNAAAQLVANNQ